MIRFARAAAAVSSNAWVAAGCSAAAAAVAASFLWRHAADLGLLDRGTGTALHRSIARPPVALVGGLALAVGIAAAQLALADDSLAAGSVRAGWAWLAVVAALAVGLADDLSHAGWSARTKLGLQCLPALAVAIGAGVSPAWLPVAWFAAAIAAQNLANTYDHADGVLLSTAAVALAPVRPAWSAAALAVLAFNLRWRARAPVLLGDSGSHLVALLLLLEPRAWGAFLLPALDLARVVLVRRRAGRPWWSGDRAHLGHRLQARGLPSALVAASLAVAALPACWASAFADGLLERSLGLGASTLLFAVLVRASPAVDGLGASSPSKKARSEA